MMHGEDSNAPNAHLKKADRTLTSETLCSLSTGRKRAN